MKKKGLKKIIFTIFFLAWMLIGSSFVFAQPLLPAETGTCDCSAKTIPSSCQKSCGNYSLNDMVQVGINATNILLALSGSVALLFFIYGGITFLISGGSADKVSKGKQIIVNSVIGLVIIFTSFVIIQFTMDALGYENNSGIFGKWYQSK